MKERIIKKLENELHPSFLEVKNKSHLHREHLENNTGETHFEVIVRSEKLKGKLVDAHRKIKNILKDEFDNGLHALEIVVK